MQYTTGEANVLVSSCLHYADPAEGYYNARDLLRKRFGDKRQIAQAIQRRAVSWTEIKEHDAEGLSKFALFLTEAEHTMRNMQALNELNHTTNLQILMQKLPYRLRGAWRSKVYDIESRGQDHQVTFHDFVEFTDRNAKIMMNPVFGGIQSSTHGENRTRGMTKSKAKPIRSFATSTEQKKTSTYSGKSTNTRNCEYCKGTSHNLETCFKLAKLSNDEKLKFVRQLGMCFACLKKENHISKNCKNKLVCKKCAKRHPTVLHQERYQEKLNDTMTRGQRAVRRYVVVQAPVSNHV